MSKRNDTHIQVLLPEIKAMPAEGKTQREIAEHLGISQVQVSRLEKKLLLQMREKIAGKKFQKNIDNPKIIW